MPDTCCATYCRLALLGRERGVPSRVTDWVDGQCGLSLVERLSWVASLLPALQHTVWCLSYFCGRARDQLAGSVQRWAAEASFSTTGVEDAAAYVR